MPFRHSAATPRKVFTVQINNVVAASKDADEQNAYLHQRFTQVEEMNRSPFKGKEIEQFKQTTVNSNSVSIRGEQEQKPTMPSWVAHAWLLIENNYECDQSLIVRANSKRCFSL